MDGLGVPGGGLPAGATNLTQLQPGVWGWAGADQVNSALSRVGRDLDRKGGGGAAVQRNKLDEIVPFVMLGLEDAVLDAALLSEKGVKEVIAVGVDLAQVCDPAKCPHTCYALEDEDNASILPFFPKAFKKIDGLRDVEESVLVYCKTSQGSTALVVGYLMAKEGMSYEDAIAKVTEVRKGLPESGLNKNLSRQLTTWRKWPEFPGLPDWI